jgi:hypothetical protein
LSTSFKRGRERVYLFSLALEVDGDVMMCRVEVVDMNEARVTMDIPESVCG